MYVDLDSSRVYLRSSHLVELVEQVTHADPNAEHNWIEWKSSLDLMERRDRENVARHTLAFSNRSVLTAQRHCEGHAYLIIGADTDGVHGARGVDPATLEPALRHYTGRAVKWEPQYITVQGCSVLIVIIDPPSPGDPIHPLRADFAEKKPRKGAIFVRRVGATETADDHEIDELVARARASNDQVQLEVSARHTPEVKPDLADLDEFIQRIETDLLDAAPVGPVPDITRAPGANVPWSSLLDGISNQMETDRRTRDQFTREVRNYLTALRTSLDKRRIRQLAAHEPLNLILGLTNLTDISLKAVVRLRITGPVSRFPAHWEKIINTRREPPLPAPPEPWGTMKPAHPYGLRAGSAVSNWDLTSVLPPINRGAGPGFDLQESDKTLQITFDPVTVNAYEQDYELPPVPLLITQHAEGTVTCEWTTTAHNARGRVTGTLELTCEPSTFAEQLPNPSDTSG